MDSAFFAQLGPSCPICRVAGHAAPLQLSRNLRSRGDEIGEGILLCPRSSCLREFPIVDGLPLLFADLPGVMAAQGSLLLERQDLTAEMESLLGDALGPGSAFDVGRQHLSTYAESHWGDLAQPADDAGLASAESFRALLARAFELAAPPPEGPILDLGCALGRASFELAERVQAQVLGVDLHLGLLRRAAVARSEGLFHYPRRQVGLVYDRVEVDLRRRFTPSPRLDFWAADALDLPVGDATFASVLVMNLLDCVSSPWDLLREIRRVLRPGGIAWLATPWDWSTSSTTFKAWLGGHSQRGTYAGRSSHLLRALLDGRHPSALDGFAVVGEELRQNWRLRLHERSSVDYAVDLLVLQRLAEAS